MANGGDLGFVAVEHFSQLAPGMRPAMRHTDGVATLAGRARQATSPEVKELRAETTALKEFVADLTLENRLLKKSMIGDGECLALASTLSLGPCMDGSRGARVFRLKLA